MNKFMKRTTLVLEDGCMETVRAIARKEKRQLSQVVNELLLAGLRRKKSRPKEKFDLPVFSMGRPKVNLGDRNALETLMDS
ncbi:MAG: hypothetical protein C0407_06830 [Desulfobacca sp.]|nr:hypothetical protein [Desulfobacca sp.]